MKQIPAISIMGWSGSGKTTLIEKLIPIFHRWKIRVGVLKHDGHDFEMDRSGKDTGVSANPEPRLWPFLPTDRPPYWKTAGWN